MKCLRKKILELLKESEGNFVSGAAMAKNFSVTRTAIWKHINTLKKNGYEILGAENKGYMLKKIPDLLMPEIVQPNLQTKIFGIGEKMIYQTSVDSTNGVAKKIAQKNLEDGIVVVAEEQTGGRGRLERSFFSPKEKGIWFSVILRPKCTPKDAPKFTLTAAVAVALAMEKFGLRAEIKWPNDIMHDGRKLVGILTEMSAEIERVNYIIVGVGINMSISRKEFPTEIRDVAASISEMSSKEIPRVSFFSAVLEEFDELYRQIGKEGFEKILQLWRKFNVTLGREVKVISAESGETFTGLAADIDPDGALLVDTAEGRRAVYAGDVSIRNAK